MANCLLYHRLVGTLHASAAFHSIDPASWYACNRSCSAYLQILLVILSTTQDTTSAVALACRLLPESATWTIDDGAVLVGNTAGGSAAGLGGALLVSTLGRCDQEGRPTLPLSA